MHLPFVDDLAPIYGDFGDGLWHRMYNVALQYYPYTRVFTIIITI